MKHRYACCLSQGAGTVVTNKIEQNLFYWSYWACISWVAHKVFTKLHEIDAHSQAFLGLCFSNCLYKFWFLPPCAVASVFCGLYFSLPKPLTCLGEFLRAVCVVLSLSCLSMPSYFMSPCKLLHVKELRTFECFLSRFRLQQQSRSSCYVLCMGAYFLR